MLNSIIDDYKSTLEYLFSQLPMFQRIGKAAYKDNLDNTLALDEYFGKPHHAFKTVHVAGTNGKGSVSHMLAAVFQSAGYKTGLYTSPHLTDFRERIKINGNMISKAYVVDFVAKHKAFLEKISPSFFELTVALAFDYFRNEKVDIAIVEVGMGGRLDSTNIISPEISIITNIGFDHTQFLGETLASIAAEKAGIIKSGIPVIIGEYHPETFPVFKNTAEQRKTNLFLAPDFYSFDYALQTANEKQNIHVINQTEKRPENYTLDLLGHYQHKNILTVLTALKVLKQKWNLPQQAIQQGLQNAAQLSGLKGRWQIIDRNPLCIADTGHNTEGITLVMEQIFKHPWKKLHIVLGMVDDKDVSKVLELMPQEAQYYFTNASIPRAMPYQKLMDLAKQAGLQGSAYATVIQAYQAAHKEADPYDFIYIGGSTFVVADLLAALETPNN